MGPDLALGGTPAQSSTYENNWARYAIDGYPQDTYIKGSCTHTNYDYDPWWKVTFKHNIHVKEVVIVNRGDCCGK